MQRKPKNEVWTLSNLRLHFNVTSEGIGNVFTDCQPKPHSFFVEFTVVHDLSEVPEKTGNLISRHSYSCVLDYYLKSAAFPINLTLQSDLSFLSVLDCIAEKVNNDLL
jgi:hypothetical protein